MAKRGKGMPERQALHAGVESSAGRLRMTWGSRRRSTYRQEIYPLEIEFGMTDPVSSSERLRSILSWNRGSSCVLTKSQSVSFYWQPYTYVCLDGIVVVQEVHTDALKLIPSLPLQQNPGNNRHCLNKKGIRLGIKHRCRWDCSVD